MREIKAVACNFHCPTKSASKGTLAFLVRDNPGWGNERVILLYKSRKGRWIEKWERIDRLTNFRLKTVVDLDPVYGRLVSSMTRAVGSENYVSDPFQYAEVIQRIARLSGMRPSLSGGFEEKGTRRD